VRPAMFILSVHDALPISLDLPLLLGCLVLLGLGLVMVTSASSEVAAAQAGGALHYGVRQASFLLIGLLAGVVVLMVPVATWQRLDRKSTRLNSSHVKIS